jgi:CRISPR-associated protein Cas4
MPNKLLNVTDLSAYLFCARKFYLEKVKGLKAPVNKAMIEGSIRHKVLEEFSIQEERLVESFGSVSKKEIVEKFHSLLDLIIKKIFSQSAETIQKFGIDVKELYKKIFEAMENDLLLRASSIDDAIRKGFTGKDLWANLEPKYISEMELISEELGLKGRADRIMISEDSIVPFELKTRAVDKVWPSDEVQLTCYSMMLEEKYGKKIPLGILEAGNKKHEIVIDEKKKREVVKLIGEVNEVLDGRNLRFPSSFGKCQSCPWKKECDEL